MVVFSVSISQAQSIDLPANSYMIISNYKAEAEAPFFSKAGQWIFWGLAPDYFTLYECKWTDNKVENFIILLVDDEGTNWVELYSDTLKKSVVKLPDDTVKTMGVDGIRFIGSVLKFFTDTSPRRYLAGKVTLGGDSTLYASAVKLESSIPDSQKFRISTYDDYYTYIDGEVLIEKKNNVVVYNEVNVFVKKSNVRLKLTLLNTQFSNK